MGHGCDNIYQHGTTTVTHKLTIEQNELLRQYGGKMHQNFLEYSEMINKSLMLVSKLKSIQTAIVASKMMEFWQNYMLFAFTHRLYIDI